MEEKQSVGLNIVKSLPGSFNLTKTLIMVLVASIILGGITGYILSSKTTTNKSGLMGQPPKSAGQDSKTFRDFAEGIIKAKPAPKDPGQYSEGTHTLERTNADPVALTSSVVDLSLYEGKKVKVFGETQKALKEGWLMDVGKVEEIK